MKEDTNKKKKIIICVIAVILVAVALIVFLYFKSQIRATTMRILRLEGEVTLTDDGKEKTVRENIRLNDGNALATAIKSLVSIGLDDTKIITLDQLSRAEFNKSGRKLDLELTDGSLFFEVQKPLEDDESFEIRTSTMVVGIRGTSGWVSVEGEHESLIVTDGHVHVVGINPTTGEKKEIEVYNGQMIKTYLYNDRDVDSIMFHVDDVTERDLPEFVLERLRENPQLLEEVCSETDWDKPWIINGDTSSQTVTTTTPTPTPEPIEEKTPETGTDDDDLEDDEEKPAVEKKEISDISAAELDAAKGMMSGLDASTGLIMLPDGTLFDPVWYAQSNPDVVAKYGLSMEALLAHYLKFGKSEGRPPVRPVTPTPKPAETNEGSSDDEEEIISPTPTVVVNQVVYNTVGPQGDFILTDGSTGVYQNGKLDFSSTGSNGKITIPATMEINGTSTNITKNMIGDTGSATSLDASAVSDFKYADAEGRLLANGSSLTEVSTANLTMTKDPNDSTKMNINVKSAPGSRAEARNAFLYGGNSNVGLNSNVVNLVYPAGNSGKTLRVSNGWNNLNVDLGSGNINGEIDQGGAVRNYTTSVLLARINDNGEVDNP